MSDVTFDMSNNKMEVHHQHAEPWKVTLVDTGEKTQTGGRIKRVREYLNDTFCMTYGDGVSDIDITQLIAFHQKQQTYATVTAVRPTGRFGTISISGDRVKSFKEKPKTDGRWISGGFFVCEPEVIDFIDNDESIFERAPLARLVADNQLSVWKHKGFWSTMDTMRERHYLEQLWKREEAPWKVW